MNRKEVILKEIILKEVTLSEWILGIIEALKKVGYPRTYLEDFAKLGITDETTKAVIAVITLLLDTNCPGSNEAWDKLVKYRNSRKRSQGQ